MENTTEVLNWLRPAEFEHLKRRGMQHIVMLLSVDLMQPAHLIQTLRAGQAHIGRCSSPMAH